MRYLQTRLHSRSELQRKLKRQEWGDAVIDAVLEDLSRMEYLDDARFAKTKALALPSTRSTASGAYVELIKSGVKGDVAAKALEDVYEPRDSTRVARELAMKQRDRLRSSNRWSRDAGCSECFSEGGLSMTRFGRSSMTCSDVGTMRSENFSR